ncbi:hypothetical protein [Bacteroides sp. 51]|uniref:hypothetical protein n=1 Tax=Bacteroides sp. 51 TaxID=2302938 RepID=UPI0013CF99D1|nr:hypothetical protein [Bacteroides sp. 51]
MKEKKKYPKHEEDQEQFILSEPTATYHVQGKRPCQFTMEELKEEIRQSMEDIKAGRVHTWEEIKADMDSWLQ